MVVSFPSSNVINGCKDIVEKFEETDRLVWTALINDIIDQSFEACNLTTDVCSNSSPEGNLPASFEEMQLKVDQIMAAKLEDSVVQHDTYSQLILNSCFRSVKEASSLLESIITTFVCNDKCSEALVTSEKVREIGDILCSLLCQLRHRGSFSTVQSSFASIVEKLAKIGNLYDPMIKEWLDHFINQMNHKISITRRSAGLPYAVVAILRAPTTSQSKLIEHTVTLLCDIGSCHVANVMNEDSDFPEVHALNILRVLIDDSKMALFMDKFLGDIFVISMNQFQSPVFPVRNCAAMLYSVLLDRCFPILKTEDATINTTSAREFFAKFPNIYQILLSKFKDAIDHIESGQIHPVLHPILILLSRIKYAELEDDTKAFTLSPFLELTKKCAKSHVWKIRELAARVIAIMCSNKLIFHVLELESTQFMDCPNNCHGIFLQLSRLFGRYNQHTSADVLYSQDIHRLMNATDMDQMLSLQYFDTLCLIFEILCNFLERDGRIDKRLRQAILDVSKKILDEGSRRFRLLLGFSARLSVLLQPDDSYILHLLQSRFRDVRENALQSLLFLQLSGKLMTFETTSLLRNSLMTDKFDFASGALAAQILTAEVNIRDLNHWLVENETLFFHLIQQFSKNMPYETKYAYLLLFAAILNASLSSKACNADQMSERFVEASLSLMGDHTPSKNIYSLLEAIQSIDPISLITGLSPSVKLELFKIIDWCANSDLEVARFNAAKIIKAFCKSTDTEQPLHSRLVLRFIMIQQIHHTALWDHLLTYLAKPILIDFNKLNNPAHSDELSLFNTENPNHSFEELQEIVLSAKSLIMATESKAISTNILSELDKVLWSGDRYLKQQILSIWDSADPYNFAIVAKVIACAHVLSKCSTHNKRRICDCLDEISKLDLHPTLKAMAKHNAETFNWDFVCQLVI